jgi:hypothetical protein
VLNDAMKQLSKIFSPPTLVETPFSKGDHTGNNNNSIRPSEKQVRN